VRSRKETHGIEPYYGFTLDGNGRYLLGDFTMTHNTCASIAAAEILANHMNVTVLLPASLKSNFMAEIQKCGNGMFKPHQPWTFYPKADVQNWSAVIRTLGISPKLADKNRGVWLAHPTSRAFPTKTYAQMTNEERHELEQQIADMINHHYTFISYNGIRSKHYDALTDNGRINPFDNRVVIVDEVHNFISMAIGGVPNQERVGRKLYDRLMEARNAKIILLSGTPVINYPHEIANLLNLAHGYQRAYHLKYNKPRRPLDVARIIALLEQHPHVDSFTVREDAQTITVSFLPEGFAFVDKARARIARVTAGEAAAAAAAAAAAVNGAESHEHLLDDLMHALSATQDSADVLTFVRRPTIKRPEQTLLLPAASTTFNEFFIDEAQEKLKNVHLFSRRMQGLVSYYEVYTPELYPRQLPMEIVQLPMSPTQFTHYVEVRYQERQYEEQARINKRRRAASDSESLFSDTSGVYRMASRALCNFVFPPDLKRPYGIGRGAAAAAAAAVAAATSSSLDGDEDDGVKLALQRLYEQRAEYLKLPTLKQYSPKMYGILKRMRKNPGTSLIYSQFRNVEGIAILAMALEANGYAELKVKRTTAAAAAAASTSAGGGGGWALDVRPEDMSKPKYICFDSGKREETQILLNLFNSTWENVPPNIVQALQPGAKTNQHGEVAKVMMITESGSEGISLKNVRQVHILEPYWNNIRIDQVIGRAVRAHSHAALPPEEREVAVFMYLATLTQPQLAEDHRLRSNDRGMTSDQYLHDIAMRKARIVSSMLQVVKESAVDCGLHEGRHADVRCRRPPSNRSTQAIAFPAHIQLDETDAQFFKHVQEKKSVKKLMEVSYKGVSYALDTESMRLYDLELSKAGVLREVGHVSKTQGGRMKIHLT
jgi:hypothetical protein